MRGTSLIAGTGSKTILRPRFTMQPVRVEELNHAEQFREVD